MGTEQRDFEKDSFSRIIWHQKSAVMSNELGLSMSRNCTGRERVLEHFSEKDSMWEGMEL